MTRLYKWILLFALLAFSGLSAQTLFTASLTPQQETHDVDSDASGTAAMLLNEEGLSFLIAIDDLEGNFVAAHFHSGPTGVNGGVVRTLTADFNGNIARGMWTASDDEPLTDELRQSLLKGELYINVHTDSFPAGELRGQVKLASGSGFTAKLTPEQETHDVTSEGAGTAAMTLTDQGLVFALTVSDLSASIAAAHFHNGRAGLNGGVVRTISGFMNGTALGVWTAGDDEPLTDELIDELYTGGLYINVHTSNFPAGELRGQVFPAGGWGFSALLDAEQETEDVESKGRGTASITFTPNGLVYHITVDSLTGDIAAAHFHNAAEGTNGPVVRDIPFDGTTASGTWRFDDAEQPLTRDMVRELFTGNIYINVHTAQYPGGEVRGQVRHTPGTTLSSQLTGAQGGNDVPGMGTGTFYMTPTGLAYSITVDDLTGPVIAAHFHSGAIGENGGVVKGISFDGTTAIGIWSMSGDDGLDSEAMQMLLKGELYVNVHTAEHPGGEIRGQVIPNSGAELSAKLTAAQEQAGVQSNGMGTASMMLTKSGLTYSITVDSLTAPVAAAHFHRAPIGQNGGVVKTINFSGNTVTGVWQPSDSESLDAELRAALVAGDIYINVHTSTYPGGEIRGQVCLSGGVGFLAQLRGLNDGVSDDIVGAAALNLNQSGLTYNLTSQGADGQIDQVKIVDNGGSELYSDSYEDEHGSARGEFGDDSESSFAAANYGDLYNENLSIRVTTEDNGEAISEGVITSEINTSPTSIGSGMTTQLRDFTLHQNYPNPFNPSTQIAFELQRAGEVTLRIYDLLGREVRTLVNGTLQAGAHTYTWNGVDNNGNKASSGIYLYQIQTEFGSTTKKMTLVK